MLTKNPRKLLGVDMRLIWLLLLVLFLATTAFSETITEEKAKQAALLLELSLKCPIDEKNYSDGRSNKFIYESVGDLETMQITDKSVEFSPTDATSDNSTVGIQSSNWWMTSARFDRLGEVVVNDIFPEGSEIDPFLSFTCKVNHQHCFTRGLLSGSSCSRKIDGTNECTNQNGPLARGIETSNEDNLNVRPCKDKFKSVTVALKLLIQYAVENGRPSSGPFYHVVPSYFVPIRESASKEGTVLGIVSSQSGSVVLNKCKAVPGFKSEWCNIKWGGVTGWISRSHLTPD